VAKFKTESNGLTSKQVLWLWGLTSKTLCKKYKEKRERYII